VIKAAGGLVVRDGTVLLVHRPKYDDWSLPKGKLEPGEGWKQAAVREVEEETSLHCRAGEEVGRTHYTVGGEPKEVRYFRMSSEDEARPQNEVDELRWVTLDDALGVLSHSYDRELVSSLR
jgi:8-oxo-dGTP diphosphatase